MQRTSSVVVGYDGSGRALSALKWAAREATDRGLPLRVIRAIPYAAGSPQAPRRGEQDRTHEPNHVLDEGIRMARTLMGEEQVSGACVVGHPAGVLAVESEHAALVVVGQRAQDAPVSSAIGSTSVVLANRAHCPVVVARGAAEPERCALPVAVGVTGDASSRAALDFAAHTAQLRGVPLTVVVAWSLPPVHERSRGARGFDTLAQWTRDLSAKATALADVSEDHVHQEYPALVTRTRVEQVDAPTALERASRRAGLLVLGASEEAGSRSGAGALGRGWSQVVAEALGRAACPVVVVRDRTAAPGKGYVDTHPAVDTHSAVVPALDD